MVRTPHSTFVEQAERLAEEVDAALVRHTEFDPGCPARLRDAIRHSLLAPGKRLRPLLVLWAADACGCPPEAALPAACAVEMVHAYSLIHDDLPAMDDDDMRRGRPSCHAQFGEATAILAGDALQALAFQVLAQGIRPADVACRCTAELARAAGATGLVGGQADDLAAEFADLDLTQLESIHRRKTGTLMRIALRLGGLVAQTGRAQLSALDAYGTSLGLAFQIVDDLLDLEGDAAVVGKRTQKDAPQGKRTFPALLGAEASRTRAAQLIDAACRALEPFGTRAAHLEELARFVLDRNR